VAFKIVILVALVILKMPKITSVLNNISPSLEKQIFIVGEDEENEIEYTLQ
jgi:hypothetical protein